MAITQNPSYSSRIKEAMSLTDVKTAKSEEKVLGRMLVENLFERTKEVFVHEIMEDLLYKMSINVKQPYRAEAEMTLSKTEGMNWRQRRLFRKMMEERIEYELVDLGNHKLTVSVSQRANYQEYEVGFDCDSFYLRDYTLKVKASLKM